MQKLIFIRRSHGTSKKNNDYDLSEVSDGRATFTLANSPNVIEQISELADGDEFNAEVHVSPRYGSLSGTIVAVELT